MGAKKKRKSKDKSDWTITDWEKWLWKIFSQFIRLRDCLKTTGVVDRGRCVTCGRIYPFSKLQAGHFIPGRTRAILFDERCVHAQCYRCNVVLGGNWPPYYKWMVRNYGQEIVENLINLWNVDASLDQAWFEQSYDYYAWHVEYMRQHSQLNTGEKNAVKNL